MTTGGKGVGFHRNKATAWFDLSKDRHASYGPVAEVRRLSDKHS